MREKRTSDSRSGRDGSAPFLDPRHLETLLRRRADLLARRVGDAETTSTGTPMLVFRLGENRFALELSVTKQVVPFKSCTRVPGASFEVLGVMNVYGDIQPVIDVGRLLDLPESESPRQGYVLLLEEKSSQLGVRVDLVEGIVPITDVESWNEKEGHENSMRCAKGMTGDSIVVLDAAAILAEGLEEAR